MVQFHALFWEIEAALNEIGLKKIKMDKEQEVRRATVSRRLLFKLYFKIFYLIMFLKLDL